MFVLPLAQIPRGNVLNDYGKAAQEEQEKEPHPLRRERVRL